MRRFTSARTSSTTAAAVFEGPACYATPKGSACFRLDEHLTRLQNSAKIYRMEYPLDLAGWRDAVLQTIHANQMKACYIRPLVYRGYDTLGVNPLPNPVDAAILVWEWGAYLGQDAFESGVDMKISTWARMAPNTLPSMAKATANYANSALIKMEALADGSPKGWRSTCPQRQRRQRPERVIVREGDLPPPCRPRSCGITRDSIIRWRASSAIR